MKNQTRKNLKAKLEEHKANLKEVLSKLHQQDAHIMVAAVHGFELDYVNTSKTLASSQEYYADAIKEQALVTVYEDLLNPPKENQSLSIKTLIDRKRTILLKTQEEAVSMAAKVCHLHTQENNPISPFFDLERSCMYRTALKCIEARAEYNELLKYEED